MLLVYVAFVMAKGHLCVMVHAAFVMAKGHLCATHDITFDVEVAFDHDKSDLRRDITLDAEVAFGHDKRGVYERRKP